MARYHSISGVCAVALVLLSGCYTIKSHETTHPVVLEPCRRGPGGAEGELFETVGLTERAYSGEKVSFGLFPGYPFFAESLGVGTAGSVVLYAIWCPVGNLFFALPTICTVCVEPIIQTDPDRRVADGDLLSVGLVGAFRWKSPSRVEQEESFREKALLDGKYETDVSRIACAKAADGTRVYFEYPGFRELKKTVDQQEKADVVFADGSRIRRFALSDNDERHLTFEDRDIADEPALGARFARHCEWKSLLAQVQRLRYAKGYSTAPAAQKDGIAVLEAEIAALLPDLDAQARADIGSCQIRLRQCARNLAQ